MTTTEAAESIAAVRSNPNTQHTVVEIDIRRWDAEVSEAIAAMLARQKETGIEQTVEFAPVDRSLRSSVPFSEYEQGEDGKWRFVSAQNACCDCGLTHNYEYRVLAVDVNDADKATELAALVNSGRLRFEMRSWSNPQATAIVRNSGADFSCRSIR